MKTLFIYNLLENGTLKYFIIDGDLSKFDGLKINGCFTPLENEFFYLVGENKITEDKNHSSKPSFLVEKEYDFVAVVTDFTDCDMFVYFE